MVMSFRGKATRLTESGLLYAATAADVLPAAMKAVIDVETSGVGTDKAGRIRMLFEPVQFYKRTEGATRARAVTAGLALATFPKGWRYPSDSYPNLTHALAIDEAAALESASWGLPQIMGFNHELAGYPSAAAMITAFIDSEDAQIAGMASFLKKTGLAAKLRAGRWAAFAAGYNGPGYERNAYDRKLATAYERAERQYAEHGSFGFPHVVTSAMPEAPKLTHDVASNEVVVSAHIPPLVPSTGQGPALSPLARLVAWMRAKA